MVAFTLTSPAFSAGATIPTMYTGDGPDLSPPLEWVGPPGAVKSFVLIVDDPDAPVGTWVHWVLAGIPPDRKALPEGMDSGAHPKGIDGAVNGKNDFGKLGYGGPAPPRGPVHRYFFKLYALDTVLPIQPGATKAEVEKSMKGHVLGEAELMGRYQRK